jgi:hypothetical protein
MKDKPYFLMLVLAILAGFVGGTLASRGFMAAPVFAQKEVNPPGVIEAEEFRLVDKDGKTAARLTMRDGNILAEIPDLTRWTIQLLKGANPKE